MTCKPKILLVSPARERNPGEDFIFKLGFLNLPYLAAATPDTYETVIVDDQHQEIDYEADWHLVGLTGQTPVVPRAYQIADRFRKRGVPTVMGGAHASMLPEEALEHVDSVIIGEGEFVWDQVLKDVGNGGMKRIYKSGTEHDLSGLPFPRRELMNPKFYIPLTLMETTRGCPHQCDFCGVSKFFGHRYRKRPPADVTTELKSLFGDGFRHAPSRWLARMGLDLPYFAERRLIYFVDSNFCADKENAKEIMRAMREMDVLWWCHATVDVARDTEMLELMRDSGCLAVNIGFETLTPENLKVMHKGFAKRADYEQAISRFHEYSIGVMGTFVVGFDGEDPSIFRTIYDFVMENRLDWALTFIRTPYPGTRLLEEMEDKGRILTRDWEKYDTLNCIIDPVGMTTTQLEDGLRALWKKVFSFPSIIRRIFTGRRVHPMFYFGMNMQFFQMCRRWKPQFDPFVAHVPTDSHSDPR